jgi:mannose-1-phosphate guanylyltransferase
MFVFHAGTFLECLARFKPDSHAGLMKIQEAWGTKKQREVLESVYPTLPRISVDFAVMEPASTDAKAGGVSVCTVLTDVDWLDVGSWTSYAQTLPADKTGNRLGGGGAIKGVLVDCKDTLIAGESADPKRPHTVAVLGCTDLIVVHTPDATLVCRRGKAEDVKKVVDDLNRAGRADLL